MVWKTMTVRSLAFLSLALLPVTAGAQEMGAPPVKCEAPAPLPAALSGWANKQTLASAVDAAGLSKAALTPGKAATLTLHPTREVHYVVQPDKPGGSVAHGGLVGVTIPEAGTWQVSLSSGAWIDLLKNGTAVISTAHKPGAACTGIRKTVQFPLQPGMHLIQISANADPTIEIMVSRVP